MVANGKRLGWQLVAKTISANWGPLNASLKSPSFIIIIISIASKQATRHVEQGLAWPQAIRLAKGGRPLPLPDNGNDNQRACERCVQGVC